LATDLETSGRKYDLICQVIYTLDVCGLKWNIILADFQEELMCLAIICTPM